MATAETTATIGRRLLDSLLEGYAWGEAAKHREAGSIKASDLPQLAQEGLPAELCAALRDIFERPAPTLELVEEMDAVFDRHPVAEGLREYVADLMAIQLIFHLEEVQAQIEDDDDDDDDDDEDGYDDPRWASIQYFFESRGTEALHILNYLKDCKDAVAEPSIEDFLENFIIDEEEEEQDDLFVYEELIRQQELVDGSLKQIIDVGNRQREDVMRDLFTPLILFFREQEPQPGPLALAILNQSGQPAIHSALFRMFNDYWAMPGVKLLDLN